MGAPPIAISGENADIPFEKHRFRKTVPGYHPFFLYSAYLPNVAPIGSRTPPSSVYMNTPTAPGHISSKCKCNRPCMRLAHGRHTRSRPRRAHTHAARTPRRRTCARVRVTGCVGPEHAFSGISWTALALEVGKSPTEVPPGRRLPVAPPSAIIEFTSRRRGSSPTYFS